MKCTTGSTMENLRYRLESLLSHGLSKSDLNEVMSHDLMAYISLIAEAKANGETIKPGPISRNRRKLLNDQSKLMQEIWDGIDNNEMMSYTCSTLLNKLGKDKVSKESIDDEDLEARIIMVKPLRLISERDESVSENE